MNRTARDDVRHAYTSTVVSWVPLTVALMAAAVVSVVLVATSTVWWAVLVVVAGIALVGAQVSVARLSIADGLLVARLGILAVERLDVSRIEDPEAVQLDWRHALGIGMPFGFWVKMTISPGPALVLRAGQVRLRISTPHPDDAIAAIQAEQSSRTERELPTRRRWFGPKRFGVGLRPQTWQGWTMVLVATVVVIAVATYATR